MGPKISLCYQRCRVARFAWVAIYPWRPITWRKIGLSLTTSSLVGLYGYEMLARQRRRCGVLWVITGLGARGHGLKIRRKREPFLKVPISDEIGRNIKYRIGWSLLILNFTVCHKNIMLGLQNGPLEAMQYSLICLALQIINCTLKTKVYFIYSICFVFCLQCRWHFFMWLKPQVGLHFVSYLKMYRLQVITCNLQLMSSTTTDKWYLVIIMLHACLCIEN